MTMLKTPTELWLDQFDETDRKTITIVVEAMVERTCRLHGITPANATPQFLQTRSRDWLDAITKTFQPGLTAQDTVNRLIALYGGPA
jgi:hypothetical protein